MTDSSQTFSQPPPATSCSLSPAVRQKMSQYTTKVGAQQYRIVPRRIVPAGEEAAPIMLANRPKQALWKQPDYWCGWSNWFGRGYFGLA